MNSSNKTKLSLALTLAVCLSAPLGAYAGENEPRAGDYSAIYKADDSDANGANLVLDSSLVNSVTGTIFGGYSVGGSANNNIVTIDIDTPISVTASVGKKDANYNTVIINSGKIYDVAVALGNLVQYNRLYINGGEIRTAVVGFSEYGYVTDNSAIVTGGKITGDFFVGFADDMSSINNTFTMSGGEANTIIVAASQNGDAKNNKAYVSANATIQSLTTAMIMDSGQARTASGNEAYISGGDLKSITGVLDIGGISTLDSNSITVTDGHIEQSIVVASTANGTATNNVLTISGGTFDSTATFTGGKGAISNGNRLNIYRSDLSVKSVDSFQIYDLALTNSSNPTLTITDALNLQAGDKIMSTRVLNELNVGDSVNLLKSEGGLTLTADALVNGKAKQGALYIYGYELKQDANGVVVADILSKETNKQTMSVADGQLAALGMLRSGADLISGSAMTTATQHANKYDVFAAMNYGNYHMNSVSNIDVQGTSMLVGMSRNLQHTNSNTTIGAFLESGWGTYDSELGEARAKGHTNYYGLGVLARHNQDSGIYTEGSLRVGKVGNTYSGHSADDGSYDASSTYYGLHLGIGKIHKINENTNIDYYGKYFYAHEAGTDANLLGDKFDFDSIDSHRIRVGARLNNTNKNITRYVGLAYEYEFSGTAKASAYGMDIASPSAKGSSGLLELGLTYKPATDSRFSMDMGLTGYAGKRQGVSGNVNLNWAF